MEKAFAAYPRNPRTKEFKTILGPRSSKTQKSTEAMAAYLIEKYNSPQFKDLFLKAAWRIEENELMRIVEISFTKNVPRAYFITSVKNIKGYQAK